MRLCFCICNCYIAQKYVMLDFHVLIGAAAFSNAAATVPCHPAAPLYGRYHPAYEQQRASLVYFSRAASEADGESIAKPLT